MFIGGFFHHCLFISDGYGPVLEDGNDEDTFYIWLVILIVPVIISLECFC